MDCKYHLDITTAEAHQHKTFEGPYQKTSMKIFNMLS